MPRFSKLMLLFTLLSMIFISGSAQTKKPLFKGATYTVTLEPFEVMVLNAMQAH